MNPDYDLILEIVFVITDSQLTFIKESPSFVIYQSNTLSGLVQQVKFSKKDTHRALEDIYESIAELKHYRKYFFVQ